MTREPVDKTLKMYVGGAFIRSESGRTDPAGDRLRVNRASRKDLRSAVEIAGKAQPGCIEHEVVGGGSVEGVRVATRHGHVW